MTLLLVVATQWMSALPTYMWWCLWVGPLGCEQDIRWCHQVLMLLKKRLMEIPCCFPHMRTQEKGDYLRTGMWVLTRDWSCQLPSFQNSEKYMCVAYKLSRLWDCIIVTQVKTVLYENWIVKSNKAMKNGLVPSELRCVNKVSVKWLFYYINNT